MKTSERISTWIGEKVEEAGAEGVVLGISGGVDSAVVAVLAKKGLGDGVLGLIMPCHSDPTDVEHARRLAAEFDIQTEYVDLTPVFDRLLEALPPGDRVAAGNLKARLRMAVWYYFANSRNYLVAGAGNKSELKAGYFTKFGDGGVDILPLGDLLKTQVRELARELGIPEEVIAKPPSAGLWEGQTDEGEMGITYEELDRVLIAIESGNTAECNQEALARVRAMMAASQHKRDPIPIWSKGAEEQGGI
ncbi:MAG: NAD+ synthase [Chloroflexi bacterium]|nr:NAD+ synthase [Chloroflexota bacterium]